MGIENIIRIKFKWIFWVKAFVLFACCWLIYSKITDPERFGIEFAEVILTTLTPKSLFALLFVVFLMPVNWLLESMKWRVLVRPHSNISIIQAFRGVLSGLSLGFVTPHGVGDYVGRLLSLQGESRSRLIGSVWLGRAMQMTATGLFGMVGVFTYMRMSSPIIFSIGVWWWVAILVGGIILLFLFQSKFKVFGRRLKYYFIIASKYAWHNYLQLLTLSIGRYAIFSIQYLVILNILEVPLSTFVLFAGMSWMFLMKSIIPSFNFLSDLGVRELSVLTFFDLYDVSQPAILTSSLLLWLINILLPVLVGLYFVFKLKIRS